AGSGLNPEGGSRNFNFATRASHSRLDEALRLAKTYNHPADSFFLRAESFYNVATEIERLDKEPGGGPPIIGAYGGISLHEQSHGESFFALFKNRFRDNGFYLMDESMGNILALQESIGAAAEKKWARGASKNADAKPVSCEDG